MRGTRAIALLGLPGALLTGPTGEMIMADESVLPPAATRGVWYHCGAANLLPGHGAVYSGPMATYCVWHRPMAVYAPAVSRSYFVYGSEGNRPTISLSLIHISEPTRPY